MSEPLIAIEPVAFDQITLRGDLSAAALGAAVTDVTGLALPGALAVSHDADRRIVWMSTDEVLLLGPRGTAAGDVASLSKALEGEHAMALDVSDARVAFRLTGARVGEVLAKGAPLDTSDHGFPPGTARRTHMGGLAIGLWRLDAETWEAVCFQSFGHHLQAWLDQAAAPGTAVF